MCRNQFITDVDGRGGVGPIKTHFYFQKVDLGTDRHDFFRPYQRHWKSYPMVSYWSRYHSFGAADNY